MDAKEDLTRQPTDVVLNAPLFTSNPDTPEMTVGMPFLHQFLDHDIALDILSSLKQPVNPQINLSSLDTRCGAGPHLRARSPGGSQHIFDQSVDHR